MRRVSGQVLAALGGRDAGLVRARLAPQLPPDAGARPSVFFSSIQLGRVLLSDPPTRGFLAAAAGSLRDTEVPAAAAAAAAAAGAAGGAGLLS